MGHTKGQEAYGLGKDGWAFFTVVKELRSGLYLGHDRNRYSSAIPRHPGLDDDDHDLLQGMLAIVVAIPEQPDAEGARDAIGLLGIAAEITPPCKPALWALLSPEQKKQVTALGPLAK